MNQEPVKKTKSQVTKGLQHDNPLIQEMFRTKKTQKSRTDQETFITPK